MSFTNIQITHFSIQSLSERFYANGNHQCHVQVMVMKQGMNAQHQFVRVPLTQQERNSIAVANFSSSLNYDALPMPNNWASSRTRNEFDLGMISSSLFNPRSRWSSNKHLENEAQEELSVSPYVEVEDACHSCAENDGSVASEHVTSLTEAGNLEIDPLNNNVPEIFNFYITSRATGNQRLMAKARLEVSPIGAGGQSPITITATTNMATGQNVFNSNILLIALNPVAVHPGDLWHTVQTIQDRRDNVTDSKNPDVHHQRIIMHRWALPWRLRAQRLVSGNQNRFFYELGNTHQSNRFLTRGRVFVVGTSTVNARDSMTGGCVWDHRYNVSRARTEIIAEVIHVMGCSWTSPMRAGTHELSILDNYGTEHRFRITPEDTGRTLSISRIGN
ncbi:hypothetical protein [Enterobacter sp. Bisph1]|uniref:hypothetical protein n=1 Tax=Enterobacter sp. Bisph1 TaxID=1274399 RepID=UPI00057C2E2A|nr:hypothetical protein [Enterobacter sp. Bisph1]